MKIIFNVVLSLLICCFFSANSANAKQNSLNSKHNIAIVETSVGDITFVFLDSTPRHFENFLKNVDTKLYEDMKFHRVIQKFVIQTGDPNTKDPNIARSEWGEGTAGESFAPEFVQDAIHTRGAVGMAREGDDVNPQRLSSGSHFYIVQGTNKLSHEDIDKHEQRRGVEYTPEQRMSYMRDGGQPRLDGLYVVFGYVIEGMDVVDQIAKIKTNDKDAPLQNIVIQGVKIKKISTKKLEKQYSYYAK